MIILHNSFDKESREFVAANPGATVYDWYRGGREAWLALGGTDKVSAFPSVVVDVPAFVVPATVFEGNTRSAFTAPAHQEAIRKPRDMADVQTRLNEINRHLPVAAELTLGNINDASTGRVGP